VVLCPCVNMSIRMHVAKMNVILQEVIPFLHFFNLPLLRYQQGCGANLRGGSDNTLIWLRIKNFCVVIDFPQNGYLFVEYKLIGMLALSLWDLINFWFDNNEQWTVGLRRVKFGIETHQELAC
jgi:hypothetical protein